MADLPYRFRPIDRWPRAFTDPRRCGPFRAGWTSTLRMLQTELAHLNAENVVIQLAVREANLRRDGMLRADARPDHPGVILSFDSSFGPLSLPCDELADWKDNLRAVAYHLEHLRMSGIYGVGRFGEQYRGWAALPAGTVATADVRAAARVLADASGVTADALMQRDGHGIDSLKTAWRRAVRNHHPDAGGDPERFHRIQEAAAVLNRHHGLEP